MSTEDNEQLTSERHHTHGDWFEQSATADALLGEMTDTKNWAALPAHKRQALTMIATKISRILNGNFSEPDHWNDIAGYAHLAVKGHTHG